MYTHRECEGYYSCKAKIHTDSKCRLGVLYICPEATKVLILVYILHTDNKVAVFGPELIWKVFVGQTAAGLLPGQVTQLLGNHLDGVLITTL